MLETFGEGGRSEKLERAMSTMQGADQLREMESMTARDQKRAEMEQRGLSPEQIAAYLGEQAYLPTRLRCAPPARPLFLSLTHDSICHWCLLQNILGCFNPRDAWFSGFE